MSTPDTTGLPDYAPVPRSALGPALNEQGYYVGRVERNLYWITDGTYQCAFLTTSDGVVLLDAPPTIGRNIQRAVDDIASANGVSNKITYLRLLAPPCRPYRCILALRQERNAHRPRGNATFAQARRRSGQTSERGDVPGSPHAGNRRRTHRALLAQR